jgi:predicted PurR-regulated permease PerM
MDELTRVARYRFVLVTVLAVVGILYFAQYVLMPLAPAFAVVGGLAFVVIHQLIDLIEELPRYRRQLGENLAQISGLLRGGVSETSTAVEQLTEEIKRADLLERIVRLMGPRNLHVTMEALNDAGARVTRYLLMQTLINGAQGIAVAGGLSLIGAPNAVLWGSLTLVLRFIPYLGPWLAASMPIALSFAVFDNWVQPLLTVALFVGLEAVSNLVLEPWLYGSRTGVSPVALLVAATFWTWLWGLPGLFLAIPLTVCLVVMGKYIPQLGFLNVLLGDEPALAPHERYYQRLLANAPEQADDVIQGALADASLLEVSDTILLPALQVAKEDHARGALDDARLAAIHEQVGERVEELAESAGGGALLAETSTDHVEVLCVPAADAGDEIAAKLFAVVLRGQRMDAAALPAARLKAERLEKIRRARPKIVVISGIRPGAVLHSRDLCKRVRAIPDAPPIVVGLWSASSDLERARERLESAGAHSVTTSFADGLRQLEQLRSAHLPALGPLRYSPRPTGA